MRRKLERNLIRRKRLVRRKSKGLKKSQPAPKQTIWWPKLVEGEELGGIKKVIRASQDIRLRTATESYFLTEGEEKTVKFKNQKAFDKLVELNYFTEVKLKKLLSYVLWGFKDRYWHNIPYLLIANSCIYPDYVMRFYISKDSLRHPFALFLKEAERMFSNVELEIVDTPYKGTQLTTIRMKPLWEEDIDYLFCRDVDYALSSMEKRCVDHFLEQNDCIVHAIRACKYHIKPMMAGLCGFKVTETFKRIKLVAPTYESYINFAFDNVDKYKNGIWECDQILLEDFIRYTNLTSSVLSCPQKDAPLKEVPGFDSKTCLPSEYDKKELLCCENKILNFLDSLFATPSTWNRFPTFVGRAWTCSPENLRSLIRFVNNRMSETIEKVFVDNFNGVVY